MIDISPIQIIIVLVIALLVFGPKRLPSMGRELGRSLREFKSSVSDFSFDEPSAPPRGRTDGDTKGVTAPDPDGEDAAKEPGGAVDPDEDLDGIVVPGDPPPR